MQIIAITIQQAADGIPRNGQPSSAEPVCRFCRDAVEQGMLREFVVVPVESSLELVAIINSAKITPEDLTARLLAACPGPASARSCQAYQGIEAVRHFLHDCAGIEPFLEAAGSALRDAQEAAGPILNRLYQTGLMAAAKIERTRQGHAPAAVASRITDIAGKIFGTRTAPALLIVGSHPAHDKTAAAVTAAHKCRADHTGALDEAEKVLFNAQIVLRLSLECAPLFTADKLKHLLTARKNRPLLIIQLDERIPFDPALEHIYNLFVYGIGDLCPGNVTLAAGLNQILDAELKDFFSWFYSTEHYRFGNIIGTSRPMEAVLELIARISQTGITVLIQGESGTGKELVAQAIHESSPRRERPFIAVNCGALTDTLLESELFGHVRGAFTGAAFSKKGLLEEADGGTLLLDEIGDTSPAFQVKLLRVLQQGEIRRVGSSELRKIDVRILAATNRTLRDLVEQGQFRKDLYYRLNVVQIEVPALRHRRDDLPLLASHFIQHFAGSMKKRISGLSDEAMDLIAAYDWPGNVRELENAMEHAVALCISHTITVDDLPPTLLHPTPTPALPDQDSPALLSLRDLEREHIVKILRQCRWDYDCATRTLGIGRTTLWRKIKEYGIEKNGEE